MPNTQPKGQLRRRVDQTGTGEGRRRSNSGRGEKDGRLLGEDGRHHHEERFQRSKLFMFMSCRSIQTINLLVVKNFLYRIRDKPCMNIMFNKE